MMAEVNQSEYTTIPIRRGTRRSVRPAVRISGIFAVAATLVLLSGCSMKDGAQKHPQGAISRAKALTQRAELAAVRLLPKSDVKDIKQLSKGTFLGCSDGYQWSGNTRVTLSDGVDGATAQKQIAVAAEKRGDDVSDDTVLTGDKRYSITTGQGVLLLVKVWDGGRALELNSASPCFDLPSDFDRPRTF
ncbi:hypothetical protein [Curtobacterium sp. MMLR14_010]|uniref:hypothetical protein n=1 Tax=Curtobacterium sp. MMLR14_010 TaxID=1898743 RepID=UPI0011134B95|nr:hypothetical protein [Curtobacterium sp. MMLR14_010]